MGLFSVVACLSLFLVSSNAAAAVTPSPLLVPSTLMGQDWVDFKPTSINVGESIPFQFNGFLLQSYDWIAKVAASNDSSCTGYAPGNVDGAVDTNARAVLGVTALGTYDVCISHNLGVWQALSRKLVVSASRSAAPYYGYFNCAQLARLERSNNGRRYCGCYYNSNTTAFVVDQNGHAANIDMDFPLASLIQTQAPVAGSVLPPYRINQGCCAVSTPTVVTISLSFSQAAGACSYDL